METLTEALPQEVHNGINAFENFQHPLLELETYVTRSHNDKLTDSFRKFKEALTENNSRVDSTITKPPMEAAPAPPERCYMAMSSLFSANVKNW